MTTETKTIEIVGENGVLGRQSVLPAPEFDHFPPSIAMRNRLQEKLATSMWVLSKLIGEIWIEPQDVRDYISAIQVNPEQKPDMVNDDPAAAIGKEVYLATFFDNPRTGGTDIFIKQEDDEYRQGEGRIKLSVSPNSARIFRGGMGKWQEVPDSEYDQTLLSLLRDSQKAQATDDNLNPWREAVREALEDGVEDPNGY